MITTRLVKQNAPESEITHSSKNEDYNRFICAV